MSGVTPSVSAAVPSFGQMHLGFVGMSFDGTLPAEVLHKINIQSIDCISSLIVLLWRCSGGALHSLALAVL
jgi:hypothetical protein